MKGIHIFLADGFEEMEALCTADVLRRGGVSVSTVSMNESEYVSGSHGICVAADTVFGVSDRSHEGTDAGDVMIFPGGMPGTKNLAGNGELMELMLGHYAAGGAVAAICAAPGLIVSKLPDLAGKRFTCFDGFETEPVSKGAVFTGESAVTDGRLITGRGAGHAVNFGLALLAFLKGDECAASVRKGLML